MNRKPKILLLNARRRNSKRAAKPYPLQDYKTYRSPRDEIKLFPQGILVANYYDGTAGQYLVDLTAVTQGVSGAQRTGDHLTALALILRLGIYNGLGATANNRTVTRIFVFQYLGDSSVANKPIISDLLQTSPANGGGTYGSYSTYDIDYGRQYRILWDSGPIVTLGTNSLAAIGVPPYGVFWNADKTIPLGRADREIAFYTGGTTGPNHIFMLVTSDSGTITTNPTLTFSSEFRFSDS